MRCHASSYVFAAALFASSCGDDSTTMTMSQGSEPRPDATHDGDGQVSTADADASTEQIETSDAGTVGDAATPVEPDGPKDVERPIVNEPSAAQQLVGQYAMRQRSAVTSSALGMKLKSATTNYMLVAIVEREGKVVWSQRGCRSEVVNDPESTTVSVADIVPRTTPALEVDLTASQNGYVIEWEREQASIALGFRDSDPAQPLPTDKSDARVYDQDGDGQPGVTVHIRTKVAFSSIEGDTYNVQRLHSRLRGSFDGERLSGETFESSETQVLEATHPALRLSLTPQRDAAGDNSVLLVKVAQSMSCDDLVQGLDQIF